jgi:DNA-binding transcriptional MerR regulator
MRVDQLAAEANISVDTVRYYQNKGLLEPPRRQGRVAWYGADHLERIARIRSLQARGFTLATIARLLSGDLDAADEALVAELASGGVPTAGTTDPSATSGEPAAPPGPDARSSTPEVPGTDGEEQLTLAELAGRTGVPLALLKAVEAEGLLIPRRFGEHERYTHEDMDAAAAGLLLLEWGVPLSDLFDLARRHHAATEAVAREAVSMFATHVRGPLRHGHRGGSGAASTTPDEDEAARLVQAYTELLPAVNTLVGHHFTRALLKAALDHVEQAGADGSGDVGWAEATLPSPGTTPPPAGAVPASPAPDPVGAVSRASGRKRVPS